MDMKADGRGQSGFSLIELMVALVVTMIVVGAIYGLLADSQTGFRREPERTERQQNIRAAMDMIMRDIDNAGSGLPPFTQVFTQGLDACSACSNGGAPMGLNSQVTDELEMVTNDGSIENESDVSPCTTAGAGTTVQFTRSAWAAPTNVPFTAAVVFADGSWTLRNATSYASAAPCTTLTFASGSDPSGMNNGNLCSQSANGYGTPTGLGACTVSQVAFPQLIRYRIRVVVEGTGGTAQNVPVLQRIDMSDPANRTQVVARGIEDMQVQYVQAGAGAPCTDAAPCDGAPLVTWSNAPTDATYGAIVTRVIVTLSARSMLKGRIQGQTNDVTGGTALRGSLTVSGSPRSSLLNVTQQPVPDPSTSPAIWQ
jgi:type IV pilus assembly protein PilW